MSPISKFTISVLAVWLFILPRIHAQSVILPSAIRIGTDAGRLGISVLDPDRRQFELNADMDVYKYFITLDYGNWKTHLNGNSFDYSMTGNYFRTGIDYNFIFQDPDNHVIFFGLRYGWAAFDDTFNYNITDPYYGTGGGQMSKQGNKANWLEMTAGIKIRIWKGLYMGWSGRMKFGLNLDAPGYFTSYEIPGYGKTGLNSNWGLSYNIYYRLAFRDKPRMLPKSKKPKGENKSEE